MIDPIEFYHSAITQYGLVPAKKKFFGEFASKYFSPYPQEGVREQLLAYQHLLSGKMYTFMYSPMYTDKLAFYDTRPIIISLKSYTAKSTQNKIELGLNINFIPPEMRMIVLSRLYETYRVILNENRQQLENLNYLDQRPLFIDTYDFMLTLDYLWESVGNTGYKFALRNYIFDRMSDIKAIDYDDWGKSIFIDSQQTAGASIGEIYHKYWQYKLK